MVVISSIVFIINIAIDNVIVNITIVISIIVWEVAV